VEVRGVSSVLWVVCGEQRLVAGRWRTGGSLSPPGRNTAGKSRVEGIGDALLYL
jgi:hypothetical protein